MSNPKTFSYVYIYSFSTREPHVEDTIPHCIIHREEGIKRPNTPSCQLVLRKNLQGPGT